MASKKAPAKENQLTKNSFKLLADMNMAEIMAEELDGLDAGFERIKVPSAGSTMFEIPGDNPAELEAVKEFFGVILYHHTLFAYYKDKYTGSNNPPDCGSLDGVTGDGVPGGECEKCPYSKFGTGENGAKACKNRRRIFVLREGELFPLLLSLPTGSLKELTKYLKRLLSKGRKSNSVITRFTLKKAVNTTGIQYSQAQFDIERALTPEEYALIQGMTEQVKAYSRHIAFEYDNVVEEKSGYYVDEETGEVVPPLE